ncbi:unnamed protein product [Acanthoscelides obtectus]|uniref:MADF domain-containing protein n=1 Tax=Acanthoscelides obtectus TaxID=200917 RepID=A0A9P0KL63_ACAOB|nr:unnamed protein product [Acanthoscelides obtectus]CAK1623613.1 hypothetical protein AOBTE_LOCUS2094 [Acanthoscelides obtectus]
MTNWTNEKTLHLINAIHLRPELWDVDNVLYKDKNRKKDGWNAIATELEISSDEAYKKFRSLRTYVKNEAKKSSKKSGSGANSKDSTWFAFQAMQFILARDTPNDGMDTENMRQAVHQDSDVDQSEESQESPEPQENTDTMEPLPKPVNVSRVVKKKPSKYIPNHEAAYADALNIIEESKSNRRNPYSSFCDHIATKMNSYDKLICNEVEFKISKILYKADKKMLRNSNPGSRMACASSSSENTNDDYINAKFKLTPLAASDRNSGHNIVSPQTPYSISSENINSDYSDLVSRPANIEQDARTTEHISITSNYRTLVESYCSEDPPLFQSAETLTRRN